ncbi:hypothetical protein [Rhizobacter sp. Root1221]|uniref:hypothetical protein n=1 Tax=Rhizobacter sp. Root1221 TaxID=1736433 RepID=UPI0012F709C8|nr:hypothetical protein [Rhizobacter sp. Root1221]
MNVAMEFHDSEVSSVEGDADVLCIRFSAACVHRSAGTPGVDSGAGYAQALELRLTNPAWAGKPSECIGRLSDGRIHVDGQLLALVPVPYANKGDVSLVVQFANGAELSALAKGVTVQQVGEPRYVESFSC